MTREERKDAINFFKKVAEREHGINCKLAIEALEQEPFDIDQYCKEHFVVMVDEDVWDKAEKALEQEPILDKIRTEINELSSYVAKFNGGDFAIHIDKEKVLEIIDKYRGEQ